VKNIYHHCKAKRLNENRIKRLQMWGLSVEGVQWPVVLGLVGSEGSSGPGNTGAGRHRKGKLRDTS
jgi:hypothetical protein